MNRDQLREALHGIAQDAVPAVSDHRQSILNQLKKESEPVSPQQISSGLRRVRLILILILLLTLAATAYAVYQTYLPQPTGIEGARDAGKVTPLNLSQTIDDVTVTLNYAYADKSRIAVNFNVTMLDNEGNIRQADSNSLYQYPILYRLRDANDLLLIENASGTRSELGDNHSTQTASFDLPPGVPLPDKLDLTLEMVFQVKPRPAKALTVWSTGRVFNEFKELVLVFDPVRLPNRLPEIFQRIIRAVFIWGSPVTGTVTSNIVSFGEPAQVTIQPELTAEPAPLPVPAEGIGPFVFEFSNIAVLPGIVVQPMSEILIDGNPLVLEQVRVAASKIEISMCWQPDPEKRWYPSYEDISLVIDETVFLPNGMSSKGGGKRNTRQCFLFTFDTFTEILPNALQINVRGMELPMRDMAEWEKLEKAVDDPELLKINPDGGWSYQVGHPRIRAILVEMGYRIEVNGVFEVELPQ